MAFRSPVGDLLIKGNDRRDVDEVDLGVFAELNAGTILWLKERWG